MTLKEYEKIQEKMGEISPASLMKEIGGKWHRVEGNRLQGTKIPPRQKFKVKDDQADIEDKEGWRKSMHTMFETAKNKKKNKK